MPPTKRQKLEKNSDIDTDDDDDDDDEVANQVSDAGESGTEERHSDDHQTSSADNSPDTEDEIAAAKVSKSKKTLKRKRRATDPSSFGATLNALLSTNTPSSLPLSLKPSAARKRNVEKQELRAKRAQRIERRDKEDKGRIFDVIGGWGGESERALRKVAQRGVVKLFNVIAESQSATATVAEETKKSRGSGKPSLAAPSFEKGNPKKKGKQKDNLLGRGKEVALDKEDFMDVIRSGVKVHV